MPLSSYSRATHAVAVGGTRAKIRATLLSELTVARALLLWLPIWLLLALTLAGLVATYQVPRSYVIAVGTPQDEAFVRNFHGRLSDNGRPYRWSDVYGYLLFPGLGGSRPFTATVELDPGRTAPVTIIINGVTFLDRQLAAGWQSFTFRVDAQYPSALQSRDTVVELRAPDYRAEELPTEPKGVKLSTVVIEQDATGGFVVPAYATLALLGLGTLLSYLLVGRAFAGATAVARMRGWGLLAAAIFGFGVISLTAVSHIDASADAMHFVITLVSMLLMLFIGEYLAWRWFPRSGVAQRRLLAVAFTAAFGLRYGGMALPQSLIIDMPYHMKWLNQLLTGDWQSLYFPGGLSEVPREWGLNLLIPKSPLFYFVFSPLALLPFDLATSAKWLICLLDATLVLSAFWLVLRVGGSDRGAVAGAALYSIMPLAFRAFAYGILPTILAQWLAALVFTALLLVNHRWRRWRWGGFAVLLALALVAFPTVALFLTMALLAVAVVWRLTDKEPRTSVRIIAALVAAWALALVSYYGLYISPVLASAAALLTPKPEGGATVRWPGGFPELLAGTATYVVSVLPALLGFTGLILLLARRGGSKERGHALWLLVIWLAIAPIFLIVNYRVDMIGKHLFFVMLPVAVAGGVALWGLGRRGRWSMALMTLAFATVAWQGLVFWIERLTGASV